MHEPPPFKLQHVQQVRYGCDWLSYNWKGKTLHLHWIETNLERRNRIPSLTRNERRFKEAIQSGKVVNEYHSMWIDADGRNHWEREKRWEILTEITKYELGTTPDNATSTGRRRVTSDSPY